MRESIVYNKISKEILVELDKNGIVINISDNIVRILGYEENELTQKSIYDIIEEPVSFKFTKRDSIKKQDNKFVLKVRKKDSTFIYFQTEWSYISKNNKDEYIIVSMVEFTHYNSQQKNYDMIKRILENKKDIIYKYSIYPKKEFLYLGNAVEFVLGHSLTDHLNNPELVFETAHPNDKQILEDKLCGKLGFDKSVIMRWIHKDGNEIWMEDYFSPEYDANGRLVAVEGICRDITKQKENAEQLLFLTYHDQMTTCKNRRFYEEEKLRLNSTENKSLGIIFADIDDLKITNDVLGHRSGDRLIKDVADTLLDISQQRGLVCRIGGDEFVLFIETEIESEVLDLCANIRDDLSQKSKKSKTNISVSMGYSFTSTCYGIMDQIESEADLRMYNEKRSKKKNADV